jgi:hypothetical protein
MLRRGVMLGAVFSILCAALPSAHAEEAGLLRTHATLGSGCGPAWRDGGVVPDVVRLRKWWRHRVLYRAKLTQGAPAARRLAGRLSHSDRSASLRPRVRPSIDRAVRQCAGARGRCASSSEGKAACSTAAAARSRSTPSSPESSWSDFSVFSRDEAAAAVGRAVSSRRSSVSAHSGTASGRIASRPGVSVA